MGLLDRDYTQWKGSERYKDWARSGHPALLHCPLCGEKSLFWNWRDEVYECLNPECRARGRSIDGLYRPHRVAYTQDFRRDAYTSKYYNENWTPYKPPRKKSHKILKIAGIALASILAILIVIAVDPFSPSETRETLAIKEAVGGNTDNVEIYYNKQPPYSKTLGGEQIHLDNNKDAVDPTWQELMAFLAADKTDSNDYSLFSFPCGAFAEEVHNNAEAHGIRAAWGAIDFEDGGEPHALNAFHTTDRGIVFVDCTSSYRSDIVYPMILDPATGKSTEYKPERLPTCDKVAYITVGKKYGMVSLSIAKSPEYEFYEEYKQKGQEYEAKVEDHNRRVEVYSKKVTKYNQEVSGKVYYEGSSEYHRIVRIYNELKQEENKLKQEGKELKQLQQEIGSYFWESLGIVSHIKIYW